MCALQYIYYTKTQEISEVYFVGLAPYFSFHVGNSFIDRLVQGSTFKIREDCRIIYN